MHADYRKRIIRYLKRTRDVGLTLRGGSDQRLAVWSDSGWAECKDTRKSTSGVVVTMGSSVIFAKSYTQPTIANSSCETPSSRLHCTHSTSDGRSTSST